MGIFRSIKNGVSSAFQFKKWMGGEPLKGGRHLIKSSFATAKKKNEKKSRVIDQSFEAFMKRRGLTDSSLKQQVDAYRWTILLYVMSAVLVLWYDIYLLSHSSIIAVIECFLLVVLLLAFGMKAYVRYHLLSTRQLRTTMRGMVSSFKFWK